MRRTTITYLLATAVVAIMTVLVSSARHWFRAPPVVHAQAGCSYSMVSGNYGLIFSGFQLQNGKSVPFYGAGLGTADGAGNFAASLAASQNGALPRNRYIASTDNPYTATYIVNSNCTGLFTATPGSGGDNFAFVVVNGGAEILATDISAPTR